jgi:uncharacterized protein (DUF1501 family)
MVERGARYVQLIRRGWDAHGDCQGNHDAQAKKIDRPIAGLITDLDQRGLLDETLMVWIGEFGRTPVRRACFAAKSPSTNKLPVPPLAAGR